MVSPQQYKGYPSQLIFLAALWYSFCLKSCHSFVPLVHVMRGSITDGKNNYFNFEQTTKDSYVTRSRLFYRRNEDVSFTRIKEEEEIIQLPKAPFPDGPCGGSIVTLDIPIDKKVSSSSLFTNDFFFPSRSIQIWLPPEYHTMGNEKRFPVLYCHDGQNVMQDSMSWTGSSWRLMGAITRLTERNLIETPPIVVMIPSTDGDLLFLRRRHLEYGDMGQQLSQVHADHVAFSIKPEVDKRFRTQSSANHTFAMGTSLGGQASIHLLLRHGNLFGGAACLSPAFTAGTLASVATSLPNTRLRLYIDNGGDDKDRKVPFFDVWDHVTQNHWWNPGYWWLDTQLQPGIDAMRMALDLKRLPYHYKKFPGARHNERAWAQRIHEPLLYLFGPDKNKERINNLLNNNN